MVSFQVFEYYNSCNRSGILQGSPDVRDLFLSADIYPGRLLCKRKDYPCSGRQADEGCRVDFFEFLHQKEQNYS